jgi:hypothetical protein
MPTSQSQIEGLNHRAHLLGSFPPLEDPMEVSEVTRSVCGGGTPDPTGGLQGWEDQGVASSGREAREASACWLGREGQGTGEQGDLGSKT